MKKLKSTTTVTLSAADLPFSCPPPNAPRWNMHPRVFLQISEQEPEKSCPYCGTHYILSPPQVPSSSATR